MSCAQSTGTPYRRLCAPRVTLHEAAAVFRERVARMVPELRRPLWAAALAATGAVEPMAHGLQGKSCVPGKNIAQFALTTIASFMMPASSAVVAYSSTSSHGKSASSGLCLSPHPPPRFLYETKLLTVCSIVIKIEARFMFFLFVHL